MTSRWLNRRSGILGCLLVVAGSVGCDQAPVTAPPQGAEASATAELHLRMVYKGPAETGMAGAAKVVQVPNVAYWNTHDVGSWDEWAEVLKSDLALNAGPEVNQALEVQGNQATGTLRVQAGEKYFFVGVFGQGVMRYTGGGRQIVQPGKGNEVTINLSPLGPESFNVDAVRVLVYHVKDLETGPASSGQSLTATLPGGVTMEMVWIEPGTFVMGSLDSDPVFSPNELPQHQVTISKGFYLGKYEITQGQWSAVMGTTPWLGQNNVQENPNNPAVYISWDDMQAFVARLNEAAGASLYRLPTEAEWEYACRAGTTTAFSFGDDASQLKDYAWYADNARNVGEQYAHVVGMKLPNPWGLYDMHGNAWEWVQDWFYSGFPSYPSSAQADPTGPATGSVHLARGGSFLGNAPSARSAYRGGAPGSVINGVGARLLRMAEPAQANTAPQANAGLDQSVAVGATVQLVGSGSDADNDALSYRWSVPAGVTLDNPTAARPTFVAGAAGTYSLVLVVNDGKVDSGPDEVVITVEAPAPVSGGKTITATLPGGATMEMVWIDPGTFTMGDADNGPAHAVTLTKGYYLGKYELTQGQWEAVMGTQPWSGQGNVQLNPNNPTVYISWDDMQGFVAKLNQAAGASLYRLPTEAEWEYACRAGTTTLWSFGDDESQLGNYAWYIDNTWAVGLTYAQPVGTKLPNPWGLYDMHGNVWEWCQDWYDYGYSSSSQTDPTGPAAGSSRVVRGGSFNRYAQDSRSAIRRGGSPVGRNYILGARLLRIK